MGKAVNVGIMTLPFNVNYGGILQAAALYRFLQDNGFRPVMLDRARDQKPTKLVMRKLAENLPIADIKGYRSRAERSRLHRPFIAQSMPNRTKPLRSQQNLADAVARHSLDAVIVGSDQVWRPEFHGDHSPLLYWLNFANPQTTRRIAYAASFGKAEWERPDLDTAIAPLLRDFTAVSVREESGLAICEQHFGYDKASLVLDPTLLVDSAFYDDLTEDDASSDGVFLNYILSLANADTVALEGVGRALPGVTHTRFLRLAKGGDDVTIPQWLGLFRRASHVFTDSFHGTVLSILAHRPFVALVNEFGGVDRFTNLLKMLGLEDRLVRSVDPQQVQALLAQPIDYAAVDARLAELRLRSRNFLMEALA